MEGNCRSSSRLRERLARMFRPAALLRSTCNNSDTAAAAGTAVTVTNSAGSASSSSRALLAADAMVREPAFLASSRRHDAAVARVESFSTAIDRLHRRSALPPPTRFSVDAPPQESKKKERSPHYGHHHRGRAGAKNDKSKKLPSNPYGFSSSDGADTDDDGDVFSSDGKKGEAEAFFSSRSFSSDSSDFYTKKSKKKSAKPPPPQPRARPRRRAASCNTCGVRDGFRPVVSVTAAEEQVRKGFAVVKRSSDPYADFRVSMVEMIVGRQLFGAAELERLLRSYLSLNAPRHHPVILQAFSDIWVVLHGG